MKIKMNSSATSLRILRNPNERTKRNDRASLASGSCRRLVLAASPAQAPNLLVNPGFESSRHASTAQSLPTGWTYFAPPTAATVILAIIGSRSGIAHGLPRIQELIIGRSGARFTTAHEQCGGHIPDLQQRSRLDLSGQRMDLPRAATMTLGADCYVWIEVVFLDASSNLLALYKSDNFTASVGPTIGSNTR